MKARHLFDRFTGELSTRLGRALPGERAQLKMAPGFRGSVPPHPERIPDCRIAAVLALFFPSDESDVPADLLLTVRPEGMSDHAGQVAFPGGRHEPDESLRSTALRETEEEVEIPSSSINIAGALTPLYIPPSNFFVHPFVGFIADKPDMGVTSEEVARLFSVSVSHLLDPSVSRVATRRWKAETHQVPFLALNGEFVWGATAMVLSELIAVMSTLPVILQPPQIPS